MEKKLFATIFLLFSLFTTAFAQITPPTLDSPADGTVYTSTISPSLYCNGKYGASRYIFQWDTVATFDSPLLSTYSTTNKGVSPSNLQFNTQYYWRAAVTNNAGDTSAWSSVRSFTTMNQPTLDTPNDSTVYTSTISPSLYCNRVTGAGLYIFQWDTVATFDSPLLSIYRTTNNGVSPSNLRFNTQYYWRAAVTNNADSDTSAWSSVRSFTTMNQPTLDTPNDSTVYTSTISPSLYSNRVTGAGLYIFQWDTVATFDSPLLSIYRTTNNGVIPQDLRFNTQYYWRAAVTNIADSDTSAWSLVRTFTTMSAPTLSSPTNGAHNVSLNPTLSCDFISSAKHYIFEWDTVPTFNSAAYGTKRSSSRNATADNLLTADYYWRAAVTSPNDLDTSCWSEIWQFSTRPAPVTTEFSDTICDAYVWNGRTYTTSGDYTQTLLAQNQADSIVTLHLTVNASKDTLINITVLVENTPYDWNGQEITQTGEYTWHGTTAEGCDSTVVADIFVMCDGTGLDYAEEHLLTIAPNPVRGGESIRIDAEVGEPFTVEVYSAEGRLLQRITATASPLLITMPEMEGHYLIRLVTDSGRLLYGKVIVK